MSERTLYQILMVDARADAGIIALVYHALAKRYHPDRTGLDDARRRMTEINAAYAVLSDPVRREQYDLSIGLSPHGRVAREPVAIPIQPDAGRASFDREPMVPASEFGEAGTPPRFPGPVGSVLPFGRYKGWALNQVDAHDPNYIEWLERTPTGRMFRTEIDAILRRRVST